MKCLVTLLQLCFLLPVFPGNCFSQEVPAALASYISKPDPSYNWRNIEVTKTKNGSFYEVKLVSQNWHNTTWKHQLIIFIPQQAKFPDISLLVLRHIYDKTADFASLKIISDSTNTTSAILYDIPNQPLFDGLEEDDLQAYTFSKYINTGDESWPLLFPMVKSVVRAMDAIQELTKEKCKVVVDKFVISGHSKRGHTTWLTAAADGRVKGIIPIAIDILNSAAQLPHHLQVFGNFSTPSKASTELIAELDKPRGKKLIEMVDAYSYKEQLRLPKLVVSATNDQFFTTDALNFYWDGLRGSKWILYLPNANHVSAYSDPRINATAFAFVRSIATGKLLPEFTWEYGQSGDSVFLKITTGLSAVKAGLWAAASNTKDFRQSRWTHTPMQRIDVSLPVNSGIGQSSRIFEMRLQNPQSGFMAVVGEITFVEEGRSFVLSTQARISPSY